MSADSKRTLTPLTRLHWMIDSIVDESWDNLADDLAVYRRTTYERLRAGDVAGAIRYAKYAAYTRNIERMIDRMM